MVEVVGDLMVPFAVAAVTSLAAYFVRERQLRRDFELDRERVRTEFMAEQVARELLESEKWQKRSFEAIRQRLVGFEENELRRILVRAGAVRFKGDQGQELWGLLTRNKPEL